jgi:large subunit ribosomal protein L7/L12
MNELGRITRQASGVAFRMTAFRIHCMKLFSVNFDRRFSTIPPSQDSSSTSTKLENSFSSDISAMIPLSEKLEKLVSEIEKLTLIETSQVVRALKIRLGLSDMPTVMPSNIGYPAGAPGTANSSSSSASSTVSPSNSPAEKAMPEAPKEFKVTLVKFDAGAKAKIIREMKAVLPNLNLVEAKNFVEAAPKVIKEKAGKEEADKLQKQFEALGATIRID